MSMKELTCIVIGGGYAGINAIKSIQKLCKEVIGGRRLRLVLIDKNSYHLRKVLLFKPAVNKNEITVPLTRLFPNGIEIVQATVTKINSNVKSILYIDSNGNEDEMNYDLLVSAVGSVVKKPDSSKGGIALSCVDDAVKIRHIWQTNVKKALTETNAIERQRLCTIAVAGAGLSGIETSAELAYSVQELVKQSGFDPSLVSIYLFNSKDRLFPNGPEKVSEKLENKLLNLGITVIHGTKVMKEKNGILTLSNGEQLSAGLCIWTLGQIPNSLVNNLGLPTNSEGHVMVDECYRVQGTQYVYSIGDCARIVDPLTGLEDGKTCKEAIAQAERLAKILLADLEGGRAPSHKSFVEFFCFGLGPRDGMAWVRKWGLDIILTGKLGWQIRKWTWNSASLIKESNEN